MAAPIKCTLPLADILKVKLELWKDVDKCLEKMGIHVHISETQQAFKAMKQITKVVEPIPVNKVGDYCEGEDGNTTILVEFARQTSIAILDSGAGVAIATKIYVGSLGKTSLEKNKDETATSRWIHQETLGLFRKISSHLVWG